MLKFLIKIYIDMYQVVCLTYNASKFRDLSVSVVFYIFNFYIAAKVRKINIVKNFT